MNIPLGFAQVNLQYTGVAVPTGAENTFGVDQDFGMSPADIAAAVSAAITSSDWETMFVAGCTLSNIHVKIGPNTTGPATDLATAFVGSASGSAGYAGASLLISKNSATGGRKGRGRMFLPGISENDVVQGGAIDGTYRALCQTKVDSFLSALATNFVPMVLLHNDPGDTPDVVTGLFVQAQSATQRNRNRR